MITFFWKNLPRSVEVPVCNVFRIGAQWIDSQAARLQISQFVENVFGVKAELAKLSKQKRSFLFFAFLKSFNFH